MQFLKTLFWMVLAVMLVLFASRNWNPVTINLWGGLQADVKLPVLVFAAFIVGFLPMFVIHRTKLWSLKRRLEPHERHIAVVPPQPVAVSNESENPKDGRVATDSKAWPTP